MLANVTVRAPDKTFDKDLKLDLGGGVMVRLLWFGGAHTKGDELTFVEPDKTLMSGDVGGKGHALQSGRTRKDRGKGHALQSGREGHALQSGAPAVTAVRGEGHALQSGAPAAEK